MEPFIKRGNYACFSGGPLSQWHSSPFVFRHEKYLCAEQAMMRAKADFFGDRDAADMIMRAKTPLEHKAVGRTIRGFDEFAWNSASIDIVVDINRAKFSQNLDLVKVLRSAGNLRFAECSERDIIWGNGLSLNDPDAGRPSLWRGQNRLGRALSMVRDQLFDVPRHIVCATGHRPQKLYGYNLYDSRWLALGRRMRSFMLDRLKRHGRIRCVSGMALGVDQLFALVALKLRDQGADVEVACAIPCRDQNRAWKDDAWWRNIMERADSHVFVHDGPYDYACMQKRNEWMVDNCGEVLAVWDGSSGGTANCVKYARRKGRAITNLLEGERPACLPVSR